jgi:chromosome segregation ATPase
MSCFQGSTDKLRAELRVVESEKKTLQEQNLQVTERVSQLETELDKASVQIRLLQAEQSRCENSMSQGRQVTSPLAVCTDDATSLPESYTSLSCGCFQKTPAHSLI